MFNVDSFKENNGCLKLSDNLANGSIHGEQVLPRDQAHMSQKRAIYTLFITPLLFIAVLAALKMCFQWTVKPSPIGC